MMRFLNTILNCAFDLVFPIKCMVCNAQGSHLCNSCLSDAPLAERETAKWIFPIYDYRHPPIKKALWLLKYKGKKTVANVFGESIYGRMLEELSDLSLMENFINPILVPIPLSKKRYKERGYNQAELICDEIIRINSLNQSADLKLEKNVLIKPKETEHQARIENRTKRLKNIVGSFAANNAELIKGKNIILIDDITTTGATLAEARKVLKEAGAKKIIAFTVAH